MPKAKRIGILGGTFDPFHYGHLHAARALRRATGLDEVWLVPAGVPPHKSHGAQAAARQRLAMVRLAVQGQRHLRALDLEVRRRGPSYTLTTVRALQRRHPGVHFVLLLGADAARSIRTWHRFRELLARIDVVVFTRRGVARPTPAALARAGFRLERLRVVRVDAPPIAARTLRARLRAGASLRGLVPPCVATYIKQHQLYCAG